MTGHSIFIGYRRDDTADVSGRVYDRLRTAFGETAVFKDVDNLPVGTDFGAYILTILPKCRVFLAMMGPGWIEARNEAGLRRLDDPSDWVRIELETAMATPGLQIVPVLANGAAMPRPDQLPESLKPLPRLNAAFVRRDPDFHRDMDKLIEALRIAQETGRVVVEAAPGAVTAGSAAAWKLIEASLDVEDYREFERHFPGTAEVMLASRCRRQLEAWASVDKSDPTALASFAATNPFAALGEAVRAGQAEAEEARRQAFERALAERREREAQEARRKAEEEEEFRRDPAKRAFAAAAAGRPVAERLFRDRLKDGTESPQMAAIPAGEFLMGSPPEEKERRVVEGPQRQVRVPAFAAGIYPVTWDDYMRAVRAKACAEPKDDKFGKGARPVTNVSWEDAKAFCSWLSGETGKAYRLLSEAEWEYAARAGTTTPFSFGATISTSQANYDGNYTYGGGSKGEDRQRTTPVGTFPANAFGLHDMHGNVWEWVEDCYADSYSAGQPSDGSAFTKSSCSLRVFRRGSWYSLPQGLRSALRSWDVPSSRYNDLGFRVARTNF